MKQTHALIAVFALMSMTAAAQVAHAQERVSPVGVVSAQAMPQAAWRQDRLSAMTPTVGDKAKSKQTRCMALGDC